MRQTSITIDLAALSHNLQRVKEYAPSAKVLAMVKANAYGHGAVNCLPAVAQADALGVACLQEAIELQQAGWEKLMVVIEGAFSLAEWQYCTAHQIQCVVHHQRQLDWALQQPAKTGTTVWLKLNTGMNRLGFTSDEVSEIAQQLTEAGYEIVLTTHFANADAIDHPNNQQQFELFDSTLQRLRDQVNPALKGSLCNSAGIVNWSDRHYDWVRPGIILYGATPVNHATAKQLNLQPVMHFNASIMAIHTLKAGDSVGYGSRWTAQAPARIGIVSVGYADGYPRVISDDAYVVVAGQQAPIIGRVAMDMLMVDLTHITEVTLDCPVQLWGNAPTIDEVGGWNDTISYELLSVVTRRPTWIYQS